MKQKLAWILTLSVLLALCGCGPEASPAEKLPDGTAQPVWAAYQAEAGAIQGESIRAWAESHIGPVDETNPDWQTDGDEPIWSLHWLWTQPVVKGAPGAEAINQALAGSTQEFLATAEIWAEQAKKDGEGYESMYAIAESPVGTALSHYEFQRRESVPRLDGTVMSVIYEDYLYSGGAHGNTSTRSMVFDTRTGQQLSLADLSDDVSVLQTFLTAELLRVSQGEAFGGGAWFFPGYEEDLPELVKDGRWCFDGNGLSFIADPYELAPYVAGPVTLTIPYEMLEGHIDRQWFPAIRGNGTLTMEVLDGEEPEAVLFTHERPGEANADRLLFTVSGMVSDLRVRVMSYDYYETRNEAAGVDVDEFVCGPLPDGGQFLIRYLIPTQSRLDLHERLGGASSDFPTTLKVTLNGGDRVYTIQLDDAGNPALRLCD